MPKIPLITSQRTAPSGTGQGFRGDPDVAIARGLQVLGSSMNEFQLDQAKKQASTATFEVENALKEMSRGQLLDATENRLGKNALADADTGYKGVYQEYSTAADKLIGEGIKKIDPRFQGAAHQKLTVTAGSYKDRFAVFEATQKSAHRKQVLGESLNNENDDVTLDVGMGAGVDRILEGSTAVGALIKEEGRGANVQSAVEAKQLVITENGMTALISRNPHDAKEALNNKKIVKILGAKSVEAFKRTVEREIIEYDAEAFITMLDSSGLNHDAKTDMAMTEIEDRDVRNIVLQEIGVQKSVFENRKRGQQTDTLTGYYDGIQAGKQYSVVDIRNDSSLEWQQREQVVNMLGATNPGHIDDSVREYAWYQATRNIIKGEWDDNRVVEAVAKGEIDLRDMKSLVGFARSETTNPRTYTQVDELFKVKHEKEYKNESTRAKVMYGVMLDVEQYKADKGQYPDNTVIIQMLNDNAKGYVEFSWYEDEPDYIDALQAKGIDLTAPQFEAVNDPKKRADYRFRKVISYRNDGFQKAFYSSSNKAYMLGEPDQKDGYFYFVTDGVRRRTSVDSPLGSQLSGVNDEN